MCSRGGAISRRRAVVAAVLLVSLGSLAGAAGSAVAESDGVRTVYVENGTIHTVDRNGTISDFGVGAELVGRARDFDDDGTIEVPFVNASGTVALVEPDGDVRALATGAPTSNAAIAGGDLDGDGTYSVFYPNASDSGYVYRVSVGGGPERMTQTAAKGVSGVADFDGDGAVELVFAGSSSTIKYLDNGTVASTGYSSIGSNNGYGLGRVADADGDGVARVPVIDGSQNPALVAADGNKTVPNSNYQSAAKAPVGVANWTGDAALELLHLNTNGEIYAMSLNGSASAVTGPDGAPVTGAGNPGVATALPAPTPEISDFNASNPTGRTVRVSFQSDTDLDTVRVRIRGPDEVNETLDTAAFNHSGSGPYNYTANYSAPRDGSYNATLLKAVGPDGHDGAENQSANTSVETPHPEVSNASLAVLNGSEPANGSDTLRIRAGVNASEDVNLSVVANASAFGAGTVELARSGGNWTGTVGVNASGVAGNRSVRVVASNEYDNADAERTNTVFLDTAAPDANVGPNVTVTEGANVSFDADATTDRSRIVSYRWAFGDNTSARGVTAVHTYESPGTYTVVLSATDAANNTATATRIVNVTESEESGGGGGFLLIDDDGDDDSGGQSETQSEPEPSVSRTRSDEDTVRYEITHANAGEGVSVDVPAGEHLRQLRLVPARDGNFSLAVSAGEDAPNGTPAVGERRPVKPMAYWNVSHGFADGALREVSFSFSLSAERVTGAADDVSLQHYRDGAWHRIEATASERSADAVRFNATTDGLSAFALAVDRPDLRMTNVTLADAELRVGNATHVRAVVRNDGAVAASETFVLRANGSEVTRRTVSVPAGENRSVTFDYTPAEPGTVSLSVNGTEAGTLRATERTTTEAAVESGSVSGAVLPVVFVSLLALALATGIYRQEEQLREKFP